MAEATSMPAQQYHALRYQETDTDSTGPARVIVGLLFIVPATVFIFQSMDGAERAAEQAERHENALRAAAYRIDPDALFLDSPADGTDAQPTDAQPTDADQVHSVTDTDTGTADRPPVPPTP